MKLSQRRFTIQCDRPWVPWKVRVLVLVFAQFSGVRYSLPMETVAKTILPDLLDILATFFFGDHELTTNFFVFCIIILLRASETSPQSNLLHNYLHFSCAYWGLFCACRYFRIQNRQSVLCFFYDWLRGRCAHRNCTLASASTQANAFWTQLRLGSVFAWHHNDVVRRNLIGPRFESACHLCTGAALDWCIAFVDGSGHSYRRNSPRIECDCNFEDI